MPSVIQSVQVSFALESVVRAPAGKFIGILVDQKPKTASVFFSFMCELPIITVDLMLYCIPDGSFMAKTDSIGDYLGSSILEGRIMHFFEKLYSEPENHEKPTDNIHRID